MTKEEKANGHKVPIKADGVHGNNAEYLTRRIARDHPDIHARMKAGAHKSVRAAALDAGIVHPTTTIPTDNTPSTQRHSKHHLTPQQTPAPTRRAAENPHF